MTINNKLQNEIAILNDQFDLQFKTFNDDFIEYNVVDGEVTETIIECVTYCGKYNGKNIQLQVYKKGGSVAHEFDIPYGLKSSNYKTNGGFLNGIKKLKTFLK